MLFVDEFDADFPVSSLAALAAGVCAAAIPMIPATTVVQRSAFMAATPF
jgi:hypothetical protein